MYEGRGGEKRGEGRREERGEEESRGDDRSSRREEVRGGALGEEGRRGEGRRI